MEIMLMTLSFMDQLALVTLMLWPVVPMFWIPVHCFPKIFRRLGLATYLLPLVTWLPTAIVIYNERVFLLSHSIEPGFLVRTIGVLLLVPGVLLQIWTLLLLSGPVIMGMPEVSDKVEGRMMTAGPFSVVRHPTYLSHTMMLLGVFLLTGVMSVGLVALIDFLVIMGIIIPLEERELASRFGAEYEEYRKRTPARFFPWKRRQ
jgi:protein-S-isoprenylcysteine O-methyltransferase Ste14